MKLIKINDLPKYNAKIKGDAGIYEVWGINWLERKLIVYRAGEYETIPFAKIQYLEDAKEETNE